MNNTTTTRAFRLPLIRGPLHLSLSEVELMEEHELDRAVEREKEERQWELERKQDEQQQAQYKADFEAMMEQDRQAFLSEFA